MRFPKARIATLLLDWAIWGYLSYCAFFLINHIYKALIATSIHDELRFPSYGWPLAIVGSFVVALLWENLGTSIGQRAHGVTLVMDGNSARPRWRRVARAPLDALGWAMGLVSVAVASVPLAGLATFLHGVVVGSGISFIPGVPLWPLGSWAAGLGYSLVAVAALAVAGYVCAYVSARALSWLWGSKEDDRFWCDRVSGLRLAPTAEQAVIGPPRRWFRTSAGMMAALLVAITLVVGWLMVEVDIGSMIHRFHVTQRTLGRLVHPDFSALATPDPLIKESILSAMVETVFMALLATLLGAALAFPLSFLGARNLMARGPAGWVVYTAVRAFFNVFRSIEVIIWAIIFAVWVGFGPFAGVIALTIHTIAALGKLYSEQVESIDPGPPEAITAVGGRRWQVITYGIVPQIVPSFLAFTMYRWDINVRMSTIIGFVGGGGIGELFFYFKDKLEWEKVGAVVLAIVVVVWSMDYLSGRIRERIT